MPAKQLVEKMTEHIAGELSHGFPPPAQFSYPEPYKWVPNPCASIPPKEALEVEMGARDSGYVMEQTGISEDYVQSQVYRNVKYLFQHCARETPEARSRSVTLARSWSAGWGAESS